MGIERSETLYRAKRLPYGSKRLSLFLYGAKRLSLWSEAILSMEQSDSLHGAKRLFQYSEATLSIWSEATLSLSMERIASPNLSITLRCLGVCVICFKSESLS